MEKILLTQPNYAWLNKRTWRYPPYTLCLLKSALKGCCEVSVFDPNFHNLSEEETINGMRQFAPDIVGVTSISTEYLDTTRLFISLLRKVFPETIIVFGGVIPTVLIEEAMKDGNVDYWIRGEGEFSFVRLLEELRSGSPDLASIGGLAYFKDDMPVLNEVSFIQDLDSIPFPDYQNIIGGTRGEIVSLEDYGNVKFKYSPALLSRRAPFAVTITSRGCPYKCVFCAGRTVSGSKVRMRSAANVLSEIDSLYAGGIREIIFLDDHFLADRKRAVDIMNGLIERKYDLLWKCVNVTAWLLDREFMDLMYKSGCDYIAVSIESGNRNVVRDIVKKPINLEKVPDILSLARSIGFDIVANFVIGFPGETWEQIRDTFRYAEGLNADIVNFHIATPLPKTELMDICSREGLLPSDYISNISKYSGYGRGLITTNEFTPMELEILRSFEWDRINFSSLKRRDAIMRLNGITDDELDDWRINTRRNLGVNSLVRNIMTAK